MISSERIPNNVGLSSNKRLQRALEHWQPAYCNGRSTTAHTATGDVPGKASGSPEPGDLLGHSTSLHPRGRVGGAMVSAVPP
jgi:hypothetical protein